MSVCRVGEKCVSGAPADSPCLHLNVNMNVGATDVWPVPRIFTGPPWSLCKDHQPLAEPSEEPADCLSPRSLLRASQ
ncbi:hypothetical protein CapIbe_018467 [Capra ibex]